MMPMLYRVLDEYGNTLGWAGTLDDLAQNWKGKRGEREDVPYEKAKLLAWLNEHATDSPWPEAPMGAQAEVDTYVSASPALQPRKQPDPAPPGFRTLENGLLLGTGTPEQIQSQQAEPTRVSNLDLVEEIMDCDPLRLGQLAAAVADRYREIKKEMEA